MKVVISEKAIEKIGRVSLVIVGVSYILGAILSVVIGPAPSSTADYLNALASHRIASLVNFSFFTVADVFLIPASLALYHMLKDVNRKMAAVGGMMIIIFSVFDAAVTELASFRLVSLAEILGKAASDAQRLELMSSAETILSSLPVSTMLSFIISSIGLLLIALLMLHGPFNKKATYPGVFAGIAGTLAGFYFIIPILSLFMVPSILSMGLWGVLSGLMGRTLN